MLMFVI